MIRFVHKTAMFASFVLLCTSAFAKDATFCRSDSVPLEATSQQKLSDKVVFKCDNGTVGTVPELYKKGWRVIQLVNGMSEIPN